MMSTSGSQYIQVGEVSTRYYDSGHGETIVLVNGGHFGAPNSADDWGRNRDGLAAQFRVIALDRLGTGFTDNPISETDYLMASGVEHLHQFIHALGLGRVHLVGHSRGGYTAARMALEHPEAIATLTIIDSRTLMRPPNPMMQTWERELSAIDDPRERVRRWFRAISYGDEHITDEWIDVAVEVAGLAKTQIAQKHAAATIRTFRADLASRQLETHELIREGRLQCPTLVLWGYNDNSASLEECGIPCMNLIMSSVARSATHVFNRAGHYCFREQPEEFNGVLANFLSFYSH